ncbi:hypothetical protein QO016_004115 [Methylobacterium persicinum]|uniref:Uncharacterized protein n=1 Tax=Methylobacterium persicinum TaxID=374426 RepID=A0ABU0HRX9_9HYPH|nr:hypothetical protein [Methylobacterium persicinum]GJE40811.1 hypothetical protein KHHGKMAE_4910 [Methylobacterium persicinum]
MLKVLRFLRNWLALSVPLGIAIGKFLKWRTKPVGDRHGH